VKGCRRKKNILATHDDHHNESFNDHHDNDHNESSKTLDHLDQNPKTKRKKRFVYVGHNHHKDHHDENKCFATKA
jgi:hypothetical protein